MVHKKGDTFSSLSTAIIIVLFMLVSASFSDKTFPSIDRSPGNELISEVHSDQNKAVMSEAVRLPSVQNSSVLLLHTIFNYTYKIIANDKTITQGYIELQKKQLTIKPFTSYIFYYHLFSKDINDLPVLI
jgi:hypothetical protein